MRVKMAVGRLKELSADERTRMLYEARQLYVMDEKARNDAALKKGLKEGLAKGLEEGLEKGLEKGAQNKAMEIALSLLDSGLDVETISKHTGLTVDSIQSLKG
jgi:predicted transposase/invertase (TIGR01784 family)